MVTLFVNNGIIRMAKKLFEKGNPGRPKGAEGKINKTVKETVLAVFNEIQDHPKVNLKQFAINYPKDFYAIAAKLIPTEVQATVSANVPILNVDSINEVNAANTSTT